MSSMIKNLRQKKEISIKIEYVETSTLNPNSYNPNKHNTTSFDLLIQSIRLFGFTQPIVVRKGTNEIIDGEHRWRAAAVLDYERIPVVFIELTDDEMKMATIIHNRARGTENAELIHEIEEKLKTKMDYDKIMLNNRGKKDEA